MSWPEPVPVPVPESVRSGPRVKSAPRWASHNGRGRGPGPQDQPGQRRGGRPPHHARHQRAAQGVTQAHFAAQVQAGEHVVQRLAEQRFKTRSAHAVEPRQQTAPRAIHCHQPAVAVKSQQAGAQRAKKLGPRVHGQQPVAAHLVRQQAVLDVRGGHLHQRLGMALARFVERRRIQHTHHLAPGVAHRRGRARDAAERQEVMLHAGDGHAGAHGQCRAQAVGAGHIFGPHAAGQDAGTRAAHVEAVVAVQVQDHAFAVGKSQQEIAAGDLARQRFELGLRQPAHEFAALAAV